MVFSSPIFLFCFLPLVLIAYFITPLKWKNSTLLLASLLFYAWGEAFYVIIMLASIVINAFFGQLINMPLHTQQKRKLILGLGISTNLGMLVFFKYANFIIDSINPSLNHISLPSIALDPVHLPIGISFFTFQAISYLVDIYRKEAQAQKSITNLGLYISLFPQLIAGPIVRYQTIAEQLSNRRVTIELFSSGIQKFIIGLAKKVLIANTLGEVAENIFSLPNDQLTTELAWLGLICFTFQIYFDFSGYSDMAIGLGRMFGFTFLENFNYPYISRSVQDFWRRWHISLSTWFRDYLYIPLGGNRCATWRVYFNLSLVFLLCGIWHGASWNFAIWGALHGFYLILERIGFNTILARLWIPLQHIYTLLLVMIAWVFFKANNVEHSLLYLSTMFGLHTPEIETTGKNFTTYMDNSVVLALIAATIASTPIIKNSAAHLALHCHKTAKMKTSKNIMLYGTYGLSLLLMLLISCSFIAANTYNPFIYFRF